MYKAKQVLHKNGTGSPRYRGSSQRSLITKVVIFFMTLSVFVLGVRLLSSPPQRASRHRNEVNRYDHAAPEVENLANPRPAKATVPATAAKLIQRIKASTRKARKGGKNESATIFTPKMRSWWHAHHPCRSRLEIRALYSIRKITKDVADNGKWRSVYKAYEELHRTCVLQMDNVTEFFLNRKHIDGCKFAIAGVEPGAGLGNKVLSIVSAMVYAVLTQRILLVPLATAVPGVFCEPFEGSSWMVDPDQVWSEGKTRQDLWSSIEELYEKIDSRGEGNQSALIKPIHASSTTEWWDFQPQPRFFCDTEQAQYGQVEWIGFRNNLYYVPKLFAVPSFRPVLEDLFPDHNVLTHMLRSLMLPCDSVWGRVRQVHDAHFRHANQRVGVQIRYFHGKDDFNLFHTANEEHVKQCLIQNGFLPNPNLGASESDEFGSPRQQPGNSSLTYVEALNVTTVLVTSLYQSLFNRLTKDFVRVSLETGDAVGVVQLTHEDEQYYGVEVDRQALVEIMSLSLTDHLILTPLSTFGALAQGYGALMPWYIDVRAHTETPCVRALSPEPCYQIPASKNYLCPHDVNVNGKLMTDVVPYISDCHLVEDPIFKVNSAGLGMQLLTSNSVHIS